MTNLKSRRETLIAEFQKDKEYLEGYLWFYTAGFDAAISELKPEIEKLVKALDCITTFNNGVSAMEIGEAREALTKYKEFMNE